MKILVTGATGFVGKALINSLIGTDHEIIALVREQSLFLPQQVTQIVAGNLKLWSVKNSVFHYMMNEILESVDVVIHLAARVHVMDDSSNDPLSEFSVQNTDATLVLATMSLDAGVNRFVYLSSIGVNGNITNQPFSEQETPAPHNDYSISKYEAEDSLLLLANNSTLDVVIIRPPLVYGPYAPGNFSSLMKWLNKGIPLPLGAVHNQRSLIALDNLVSFITHCIYHPDAANEVFLISDGQDVSTTELLQKVAKALNKKSRLIPLPVSLMAFAAKLICKEDVTDRLFSSLQVDSSKARDLLNWKPVITMDEQLKKTADAYLKNEKTL
jgi:nucleoside-diphosphate-sugar epimerase